MDSLPYLSSYSLAELLLVLDKCDMDEILNHTHFNPSLLEECIVQGIFQTLTKRNSITPMMEYSSTPTVTPPILSEDLLVASVSCLLKHIQNWLEISEREKEERGNEEEIEREKEKIKDKTEHQEEGDVEIEEKSELGKEEGQNETMIQKVEEIEERIQESINNKNLPYLTRGLVWFLIGRTQFSFDIKLTDQIATQLIDFTRKMLTLVCNQLPHYDIIFMESLLDCCSLVSL